MLFALLLISAAQAPDMKPYTAVVAETPVEVPMVPIPVGAEGYPTTVRIGSPDAEAGRNADEGPVFEVEVEPFWIGKYEITWDAFDAFRDEYSALVDTRLVRDATADDDWADAVSIPTPLFEQDAQPILSGMGTKGGFPTANITQFAAMQFTKWLSKKTGHFYRLPTEAEWEYAARAGTTTAYSYGDDPAELEKYAWTFDNSAYDDPDQGHPDYGAGYRKVGTKQPNPWGLHDVYGNVAEWVIDGYDPKAYAAFGGKRVSWRDAIVWSKRIFPCVVRGGSWESEAAQCRSAARQASDPEWQQRDPQLPKSIWWFTDGFHIGFRIVRPLKVPSEREQLRFWDPEAEGINDVLAHGGKELRTKVDK